MARHDWVALVCEPAQEYLVQIELQRYGLNPYLPQYRRPSRLRDGRLGPTKNFPLFPPYLLLPFADIGNRAIINCVRGLVREKRILASEDGVLWRTPEKSIIALREAEFAGEFDRETFKIGEKVQIKTKNLKFEAFVEANDRFLTLMTPLFGGARATISSENVTVEAEAVG